MKLHSIKKKTLTFVLAMSLCADWIVHSTGG